MSNQEDRFDFSDSENHGNQGERYRKSSEDKNDNGKADGINWGDKIFSMIQESAAVKNNACNSLFQCPLCNQLANCLGSVYIGCAV